MFTSLVSASLFLGASLVSAGSPTWPAGVEGTGTQGVTNPTSPVVNTPINQDSMSRLLSINSIDDWCLFAPPTPNTIAESEQEEVAWCTKPRNNARLIPDGVFTGISFLKTDFYVQVLASGDFSKLNIQTSDTGGGELDPHGAQGAGNPIGGNVTTTVTPNGSQLNVGEWMQFISSTQVCIRACTNANATFDAASMCEHKLDEMGCEFVMPGNYQFEGKYESCDADVAYPPGWYPTATVDGKVSFSTFAQYFTGVYTDTASSLVSYTVGTTATPQTAAFTPSSSNCKTVSSIANNMLSISGGSTITGTGSVTFATGVTSAAGSSTPTPTGTTSSAAGTGKAGSSSGASSSSSGTGKPTSGASSDSGKGGNGSTGTPGSNNTAATNSSAARRSLSGFFPGAGALLGVTLASVTAVLAGAVMVL